MHILKRCSPGYLIVLICAVVLMLEACTYANNTDETVIMDSSTTQNTTREPEEKVESSFVEVSDSIAQKIYSYDNQNYLVQKVTSNTDENGEWLEYPEISVFINGSEEKIASLQYDLDMYEQYESLVFWLDNETVLLDAMHTYNIHTKQIESIKFAESMINAGEIYWYAVPSPDGRIIAYSTLEEREEHKYYQVIYILDVEGQIWDNPVVIYREEWASEPFFGMVWASDNKIYFNSYGYKILCYDPSSGQTNVFRESSSLAFVSCFGKYVELFSVDENTNAGISSIWDFANEDEVFSYTTGAVLDYCWSYAGNMIGYVDAITDEYAVYDILEKRYLFKEKTPVPCYDYCKAQYVDGSFYLTVRHEGELKTYRINY